MKTGTIFLSETEKVIFYMFHTFVFSKITGCLSTVGSTDLFHAQVLVTPFHSTGDDHRFLSESGRYSFPPQFL